MFLNKFQKQKWSLKHYFFVFSILKNYSLNKEPSLYNVKNMI